MNKYQNWSSTLALLRIPIENKKRKESQESKDIEFILFLIQRKNGCLLFNASFVFQTQKPPSQHATLWQIFQLTIKGNNYYAAEI